MKLVVTIPAFNEEKSVVDVIESIPKKIKGISRIEVVVVDDGSTDKTALTAKKSGAVVYRHKRNVGLARTFKDALFYALQRNADIIVNTDADNQYDQRQISRLIEPILEGRADMVTGDRQVKTLSHMKWQKKYGNRLGSAFIRFMTGMSINDASSGFRAHTRECAQTLSIISDHTYTHETLIDAYYKGLAVAEVPITFKKRPHGQSRLISKGVTSHIMRSGTTIIRTVLLYRALRIFTIIGAFFGIVGLLGMLRYLYFAFIQGDPAGHVQSLVISSVMLSTSVTIIVLGFIADILATNRRLIEQK